MMATTKPPTDAITADAAVCIQECVATLLGTATALLRPNGEPLAPLAAAGGFYRALAAYPAGVEHLVAAAAPVAAQAVRRRLPVSGREKGLSVLAYPLPRANGAALVAFTSSGVRPEMRAALAADLGLPPRALPQTDEPLNPSHIAATLRLLEQTLPLLGASGGSSDPEVRRDRVRSSAIKALFKAEDEADILRIVSETLAGLLHMDHATPYLFDGDAWWPEPGVAYWDDDAEPPTLAPGADQMAALWRGEMVARAATERGRAGDAIVPLLFVTPREKELLGAVVLETAHWMGDHAGADTHLALEIGRLTALAMHNARVAMLDRTLARALQETLQSRFEAELAPGLVVEQFYQAAAQDSLVGGDFYDVFPLPGGRVAVLVGDVAGKGLEAAVHTTLARDTLRAYALIAADPAEILRLSNEALSRFPEFRDFLTVALVILEPAEGRLLYAGAGHPPAFLYRRSVDAVGALESTGTMLGMVPGLTWENRVCKWGPGDRLLLYTDGISEAHPANTVDMFETTRIRDVFAAHRRADPRLAVRAVFDAAHAFSEGAMHDDCALLVVAQKEADG